MKALHDDFLKAPIATTCGLLFSGMSIWFAFHGDITNTMLAAVLSGQALG